MSRHICFVTDAPGAAMARVEAFCRCRPGHRATVLAAVAPPQAAAWRADAAALVPNARLLTVDELLARLQPDEDIPLWGFHAAGYHRSHRVALALLRLCADAPPDGIEFSGDPALGYVTIKRKRLWGEPFDGMPLWVQTPDNTEPTVNQADDGGDPRDRRQQQAMARYSLRYADACHAPTCGPNAYDALLSAGSAAPRPAPTGQGPLVSVIVPYYEMQDYIDETLRSIEASRHTDWEAIVVDDGSTSEPALAKFAALRTAHEGDARWRFIRKPNGGLSNARNHAIAHARGDYILPVDSDDLIHPDYIERGVLAMERCPELAAVSGFASCFPDGQPPDATTNYIIPCDLDPVLITLENRGGIACSLFRRGVFEQVHYDESLPAYEDWDLWWQLAEAGQPVEVLPEILFRYRHRAGSMVRTAGIPRHTALRQAIADRHPALLAQHGAEIFHSHLEEQVLLRNEVSRLSSELEERQAELTQRQAELKQQQTELKRREADRARLHTELTTRSQSLPFRLAHRLALLAASIRDLLPPAGRRGRVPAARRVRLEVLTSRHPASTGHEVCVGGICFEESMGHVLYPFRASPGWECLGLEQHPGVPRGLRTVAPAEHLSARVRGEAFSLLLCRTPTAGQVKVSVDGRATVLDLYAAESERGFRLYTWHDTTCRPAQPWP